MTQWFLITALFLFSTQAYSFIELSQRNISSSDLATNYSLKVESGEKVYTSNKGAKTSKIVIGSKTFSEKHKDGDFELYYTNHIELSNDAKVMAVTRCTESFNDENCFSVSPKYCKRLFDKIGSDKFKSKLAQLNECDNLVRSLDANLFKVENDMVLQRAKSFLGKKNMLGAKSVSKNKRPYTIYQVIHDYNICHDYKERWDMSKADQPPQMLPSPQPTEN